MKRKFPPWVLSERKFYTRWSKVSFKKSSEKCTYWIGRLKGNHYEREAQTSAAKERQQVTQLKCRWPHRYTCSWQGQTQEIGSKSKPVLYFLQGATHEGGKRTWKQATHRGRPIKIKQDTSQDWTPQDRKERKRIKTKLKLKSKAEMNTSWAASIEPKRYVILKLNQISHNKIFFDSF